MSDATVSTPVSERVQLDYPSADIWLHVTTEVERKYRVHACRKEPWTVGRGARAVAFEPSYATYGRLCENLQLNGCNAVVVPFPLPLADADGMTSLLYRSIEVGQSRHSLKTGWRFGQETKEGRYEQPMCTIRLDTARALFGWPEPNHVKLDVDGAELRVLKGAAETLRLPALRSLMAEVKLDLWDDVRDFVTAAGFRVARTVDRGEAPMYALFDRPPA